MEKFKSIKENVTGEIVEKKSKFIANIFYVESPEEADKYIKEMKKKNYDARHNVFAYAIETGDGGIAVKYNDDGEPQGTAGSPILKIVLEQGLSNILVVVTRYFGGILLGTGGLVRAYSGAVLNALEKAKIVDKKKGYRVRIEAEYDMVDQIKYNANKCNFRVIDIEYLEKVGIILEVLEEDVSKITNTNNNNLFKILKYDILEEKYIDL